MPPPVMGLIIRAASPTSRRLSMATESRGAHTDTAPETASRGCPFFRRGSLAIHLSKYSFTSPGFFSLVSRTPSPTLAVFSSLGNIQA